MGIVLGEAVFIYLSLLTWDQGNLKKSAPGLQGISLSFKSRSHFGRDSIFGEAKDVSCKMVEIYRFMRIPERK